jgi:hypothetical protein
MQSHVKTVSYARRPGRQGVLQTLLFFLGRMAEERVGVLLASCRHSSVVSAGTGNADGIRRRHGEATATCSK